MLELEYHQILVQENLNQNLLYQIYHIHNHFFLQLIFEDIEEFEEL